MKRIADFFVYSNLFIGVCAIAMTLQSYWLLGYDRPDWHLTAFIFFSTLCSYSFHWYLTGNSIHYSARIAWLQEYRWVHAFFFIIGLVGAGWFLLSLWTYSVWLLIAVFVTFLYSAPKIPHPLFRMLRKVAIGKTIFLAFVWMYVTTILPAVLSGNQWSAGFILFTVSRFFLIYSICILFDYRDRDDDKAAGIRSLITYLNEGSITLLFYASLCVFLICTVLMTLYGYDPLTVTALAIPGIITALIYSYARRHFQDMLYYFVLDGLMAVSTALMLLTRI